MKKEYKLIDANIYNIERLVQEEIDKGWKPLGGISNNAEGTIFYQAMTREIIQTVKIKQ